MSDFIYNTAVWCGLITAGCVVALVAWGIVASVYFWAVEMMGKDPLE